MQAPDSTTPARMVLTTVDAAARAAMATPAGPVHLNLQFREPLAPVEADWSAAVLKVGGVHWHLSLMWAARWDSALLQFWSKAVSASAC